MYSKRQHKLFTMETSKSNNIYRHIIENMKETKDIECHTDQNNNIGGSDDDFAIAIIRQDH